MHALYGDQRVMESITGHALEPAETHARIALHTRHWDERGYGLYVAHSGSELAGHILLLRRPLVDGLDAIEIGYAFRPSYWGLGLATEAARALLAIAFDTLGEPQAVAITAPQNAASRRVMEKNGLSYRQNFIFSGTFETVLYGITKEEWLLKSTPPPA